MIKISDFDIQSDKDVLFLLAALINRFPAFASSNAHYNRNMFELISSIRGLLESTSASLQPLFKMNCDTLSMEYIREWDFEYHQDKLNDLASGLLKDYEKVCSVISGEFSDIKTDIRELKSQSRNFGKDIKRLIRIAPLVYSHSGEALVYTTDSFTALLRENPTQLQNLFTDLFLCHLAPLLNEFSGEKGLGEVYNAVRQVENSFIPRKVVPATSLYSRKSGEDENTSIELLVSRTIELEEIMPVFSILRGALAGDCSMITVPFYSLLKGTKTFWILDSRKVGAVPVGYVFLLEVSLDESEKKVPYILTVNGPHLQKSDVQAVMDLVSRYYGSKTLVVPDFSKNPNVVNTEEIRMGLSSVKGTNVPVDCPEGWEEITSYIGMTYYGSFYSSEYISSAMRIELPDDFLNIVDYSGVTPSQRYEFNRDNIKELSLINRALIGYNYYQTCRDAEFPCRELSLTREQLDNAQRLMNYFQNNTFSIEDFKALNRIFDFNLEDLRSIDGYSRASLIGLLYREDKDLFDHSQWAAESKDAFDSLKELIEECQKDGYEPDDYKDALVSIPDVFIPSYWEKIKPFLTLPGSDRPDYYLINRYVKSFYSYGAILNLCNYLSDHLDVLDSVRPVTLRWAEFLSRAKELIGDEPCYASITDKIFKDNMLEHAPSFSYYDAVRTYKFAHKCGYSYPEDFEEAFLKIRNIERSVWEEQLKKYSL